MSRRPEQTQAPSERFLLSGVIFPDQPEESGGALSEARGLVQAAGGEVVGADDEPLIQRRHKPDSSTLMGKGKVHEIKEAIERHDADAIFVDNDLAPGQVRNLEKVWEKRVVDRSELILDIFSTRARTAQARIQVELAQMEYLRPRLKRMWTHLERTEGAIGTRGPGETQLETDRRLLEKRITDLKSRLAGIEKHRQRQIRTREETFTIGLVGYTNAGKSTLLNRLTGADELVADMLFATLDTRTRKWKLADGRTVLLSDTVGFLQRLPHHLVASFHATLEEALSVDVLLHVVDGSHPDASVQMAAVEKTLGGLTNREADIVVLNKVDRVQDPISLQILREGRRREIVHLSAKSGAGMELLDRAIAERLDARSCVVSVSVPLADGKSAATLRHAGKLLSERTIEDETLLFELRVPERMLGNLQRKLEGKAVFEVLEPARERYFMGEVKA